ncbi:MAG: cytidine deaminase [Synergistetes bacterium]|nr:cytidine deaminase [Synergistota bacterium]
MERKKLIECAIRARDFAYAPYSRFKVGAAILTREGKVFSGCNVENSSYGLTICAERVALFKAVSEGYRSFKAIAVVGDVSEFVPPCGACRQVLREFSSDMLVVMGNVSGDFVERKLEELLPLAFKLER